MKKRISLLSLLLLLSLVLPARAIGPAEQLSVLFYHEETRSYSAPTQVARVGLTLDGVPIVPNDVPLLLQTVAGNGRTLVPIRLVAEHLGAQVLWLDATRQVALTRGDDTIVLTLGSAKATVNGQRKDLPDGIPAGIVSYQGKESTMVPLRFISEMLGVQVDWDNESYTAVLHTMPAPLPTPAPTPTPRPTPAPLPTPPPAMPKPTAVPTTPAPGDRGTVLRVASDANAQSIFIVTDHVPKVKLLDLGDRVVVDVQGAVFAAGIPNILHVDNEQISTVRTGLHADDLGYGVPHTARVVIGLKTGMTYQKNVRVEEQIGGVLITTFLAEEDRDDAPVGPLPTPELPLVPGHPPAGMPIIALDAGHGGSASGASYESIMEKNITLPITQKLQAILLAHGYGVLMIRDDDRFMDLYDRCDIANAANATVFVSIHANATDTSKDFQGIFTYYHPTSAEGKKLAQAIQPAVAASTGAINRGLLNADFVVLRETKMPAVLVETGFMTNHEELMRLCDDAYQTKIALGIADGIFRYLGR